MAIISKTINPQHVFFANSRSENRIPAAQPKPMLWNSSSNSLLKDGSIENVVSTLFSFFSASSAHLRIIPLLSVR